MLIYIDNNQIARFASSREVYQRGVDYYKEGRVSGLSEDDTSLQIRAIVLGKKSEYRVTLEFTRGGELGRYGCGCAAFVQQRGACKHVVAVMLSTLQRVHERAIEAKSSRAGQSLLTRLEEDALSEIDAATEDAVRLTPYISFESGTVKLSFTIGRTRQYILKSILDFLRAVKHGQNISYGKELSFSHGMSAFDEDSRELVNFLKTEFGNLESIMRAYRPTSITQNDTAREIILTHAGLDRIFDLYKGQSIKSAVDKTAEIDMSDEPLPLRFSLVKTDSGAKLSRSHTTRLFAGALYGYALINGSLYRFDLGLLELLGALDRAFTEGGRDSLQFSEAETNKLILYLLPKLTAYGMVDVASDFDAAVSVLTPEKRLYLDATSGVVKCRALFVYGNNEVNLVKPQLSRNTRLIEQRTEPRNLLEERAFMRNLENLGFIQNPTERILEMKNPDSVYDFFYSPNGLAALRQNCAVFATDAFMNMSMRPRSAPSVGVRLSGNLLEISVDAGDYDLKELREVLRAASESKRYYRLKDGRFVTLDAQTSASAALLDGIGCSDKELLKGHIKVPKYRAPYLENASKQLETPVLFDRSVKELLSDFAAYRDMEFELPESLDGVLRIYQKEGYNWLKTLTACGFGGVLADDMGLGKTLQIIALIKSEINQKNRPSLIVVPTSLIYNWEREIARFAPDLTVAAIAGIASRRHEIIAGYEQYNVLITTYDTLKRDIEHYEQARFAFCVADEAQAIKNPQTQNARAVKNINADTRFAVTGTPIENSLSELWSIFDFVMPGYLFTSSRFTKHFESPIVRNDDKQRAEELRNMVAPFVLRRLKSDVLRELPAKIETTIYAEMTPEQKKLYTAYFLEAKGELESAIDAGELNKSRIEILSKLMRLRQICCHPATFVEDYTGGSGKLDVTLETVESALESGHRILIFSQFTKMLNIIRAEFEMRGINSFYLDGSTPAIDRVNMSERFNNGEGDVFLISLKAGGTGLNLTGADIVIHYDPWWNPAVMEQAADRAHRIGQRRAVMVYNIVAESSVEEGILNLQAAKKNLADRVIEEGNFLSALSEKELLELLGSV